MVEDGALKNTERLEGLLRDIAQRLPCPSHGPQDFSGKLLTAESVEAVPFACCSKYQKRLKDEMRKALVMRSALRVVSNGD